MKWIAALTNFFFPGLGYLIAVPHKRIHGLLWLAGVIGLTYVEQFALGPTHDAFWALFASVFVMNTAFAYDAFQEVSLMQQRQVA